MHRFLTDGTIEPIQTDKTTAHELAMENDPYSHMMAVDSTMIFVIHTDNDFVFNYEKTKLPVNKAIQKYFPNSRIVGDALLICVDEDDNLLDCVYLDKLKDYKIEYYVMPVGSFTSINE